MAELQGINHARDHGPSGGGAPLSAASAEVVPLMEAVQSIRLNLEGLNRACSALEAAVNRGEGPSAQVAPSRRLDDIREEDRNPGVINAEIRPMTKGVRE